MAQAPKNMHPFVKIMLAETEAERDAARAALHAANAQAPTDRQVVGEFLKDCTTMDGAPLTLNAAGEVAVGVPAEAAQRARYNSTKPFFVKGREYAAIQDAVDAAAAASLLAENSFTADITQLLQPGVYGYAGSAIPFAHFRNGADLDALAADEDGVPDLNRRAGAFVATPEAPLQTIQEHSMTQIIPAKAQDYLQFKQGNRLLIQAISQAIEPLPDDAHHELYDEMLDVIGADAANASSDDAGEQELAVQRGESWVSDNCAGGDIEEDVCMALWLKGVEAGGKYLREAWSQSRARPDPSRLTADQIARIGDLDAAIDAADGLQDSAFFEAVAAKDEYLEEQGISRDQIETTGREPRTALESLCQQTNTTADDWESMDGPETGVGVERWYVHRVDAREAYTVDDQGHFTIEVSSQERARPTGA